MRIEVTNLKAFQRRLRDFSERDVPRAATQMHRWVTLELFRRIVLKSPVDLGRFVSAWVVSLQPPDPRPVSASGASQLPILGTEEVIDNALKDLEPLRPFSICWVHNPMVYGPRLENGYSQKAPEGFVAISIAEIKAGLNK